jgi:DNA-binding transcriptional ArsR family regulator
MRTEEAYAPVEEITISDPETLKVVADSLRLQILRLMRQPRTVKEIGAALDIAPTKLYYHINQLEQHGLICVTETNVVSGIIENTYQVTARRIRIDEAVLLGDGHSDEHIEAVVSALFDGTRDEVLRAVRQGILAIQEDRRAGFKHDLLVRGFARLSPEQLTAFHAQLEAVVTQFEAMGRENADRDDLPEYALLEVFYPIPLAE